MREQVQADKEIHELMIKLYQEVKYGSQEKAFDLAEKIDRLYKQLDEECRKRNEEAQS